MNSSNLIIQLTRCIKNQLLARYLMTLLAYRENSGREGEKIVLMFWCFLYQIHKKETI